MAHNIATYHNADGTTRHSSYSLRQNPWHRLGTVVNTPLADDQVLQAAGLDWSVNKVPMYDGHSMSPVPDHRAIMRSDDQRILGVVGKDYEVFQNTGLFQVLRQIGELDGCAIETAGALGQGETVWALARIPALDIVIGDDVSQGYLLVSNSHTGQRRLCIVPTTVRVVCSNTLTLALRGKRGRLGTLTGGFAIRHTKGLQAAVQDAVRAYQDALIAHRDTREAVHHLARQSYDAITFRQVMDQVFRVEAGSDETERAKTIRRNREDRIREIAESPTCMLASTGGSAWSLLNAVTEYIDHERPTRSTAGQDESQQRFASSVFGSGATLKARAWSAVLEACG